MRNCSRAIVGVLLVTGILCEAAQSQSFGGWLPFRDDKQETFVHPPSSLGASSTDAAAGAASAANSATSTSVAATGEITPIAPTDVGSGGTPPATNQVVPENRSSFFPNLAWPQFQLPYFPRPQWLSMPGRQEVEQARNTWVAPTADPEKPSPWQAVTSGATRVTQSTANAWHKTVDLLTPGSEAERPERTRVAQREPSMWRRMFSAEPERPEGPQTVTEWMAQDRVQP